MTVVPETLVIAFTHKSVCLGICAVLQDAYLKGDISSNTESLLKARMYSFLIDKGWYSGLPLYPISDVPSSGLSALHAFHSNDNLWNINTPYGRRRILVYKELCEYLEQLNAGI